MSAESETAEASVTTVAGVDIGSNSLRMEVAEITPEGDLRVLEHLQQAARLGQDTFRRGRLSSQAMRAAVSILRDFRKTLDLYGVEKVRAVATSAVREASNADAFLDRVLMATGLDVEVIDTSEESRLTVSAVRSAVGEAVGINRGHVLIADVGGGSTLLTVLDDGEIVASQSLRLGSIRLQEVLDTSDEPPAQSADLIRHQISNVVTAAQSSLPLKKMDLVVAVGGDARFAARQIGRDTDSPELQAVTRRRFDNLVKRCIQHAPEELARRYNLAFADAETLNPALMVYQALLRISAATEMLVSQVSMRDGLLLDVARSVTGQEDEAIAEGVIHSAQTLAEKYKVDPHHAEGVAEIAVKLFDELRGEHGLNSRHRLLLQVAALVHEVGGFVSSRAHHKHSYYLVSNSEIFGLTREELQIVAHVCRYHRRSQPKPSHTDYMALPRETRMVVAKLAAILRVADALDRGHAQQARDFTVSRRDDDLVIHVPSVADLTLERRALATKGDMFEDIYGMSIRLEEGALPETGRRRARAVE